LRLDQLDVVHLGKEAFTLQPKIRALSIHRLPGDLKLEPQHTELS
jgi:hypothetical protein